MAAKKKNKKMSREEKEILEGMREVLAHLKGEEASRLRRAWSAASDNDARRARKLVKVSQSEFARLLRVSVKTVQAWEQGSKPPSGPATSWIRSILKDPNLGRSALLASH